jgi:hypothetical protein
LKKVLVSYFFREDSIPLGKSVVTAFRELGWETMTFDSQAESPLKPIVKPFAKFLKALFHLLLNRKINMAWLPGMDDQSYREKMFLAVVKNTKPDWILVIRGNGYRPECLLNLRENHGVERVIGWWVKDPRDDDQLVRDAKLYDVYFCIHRFGYHPEDRIHHLPALGIDASIFRPITTWAPKSKKTILLLGGYSPRRYEFVQSLLNTHLIEHLEIVGPGWLKSKRFMDIRLRKVWLSSGVWGDDMVKMLSSAYMVINITSWDPRVKTGQNLRLFDVPCTGTLLITDDAPEVREHFQVGEELDVFSTTDDLIKVCSAYLEDEQRRNRVAQAGLLRSKKLPSIRYRVEKIIEKASCT